MEAPAETSGPFSYRVIPAVADGGEPGPPQTAAVSIYCGPG